MRRRVMVAFGTRPEAVKMCPLVKELQSRPSQFETLVCVSGQHREMLQQVLDVFGVVPDYSFAAMREGQSLSDLTALLLTNFTEIFERARPAAVLVHGDTTTSFAAALAAFYLQIPVGHVEAGLRTHNLLSPFPEELNRQGVDVIARWLFAPTELSRANLLREGKDAARIWVTGNTVIDALGYTVRAGFTHPLLEWVAGRRMLLVTAHRRENLGARMREMFSALRRVVDDFADVCAVFPMHLNPLVRDAARELADHPRVRLIEPLDVVEFHNFMAASHLILTDSGGVQEEAPSLGKPVLVMRDTTERPEGVDAGTLRLVGTTAEQIYAEARKLLENPVDYAKMAQRANPYGDGRASVRIADALAQELGGLA